MLTTEQLHQALKKHFGYDSFRPHQEDIVQSVIEGKDTVVLMPTGGGKSICFQLPALLMDGMAIVVSPLIALMKDQVEALKANGLPAAYLNSSLSPDEQWIVANAAKAGELKLLYVSPEKLLSERFLAFLDTISISLVAVDEAHCISAWGHDFRPEYTQLAQIKDRFPDKPVIALTATADKPTRQDITQKLNLTDPKLIVTSFDRPNIELTVRPGKKRLERIIDFLLSRPNTSGIIYCLSRKSTESLSDKLSQQGFKVAHYHAGLSSEERSRVQTQFLRDEVPIICATIAFGMGIDKPNVRWVIHYNLPKNMEGYYQEIGRAGRDGLPSQAVLLYSFGDVIQLQQFVQESGQPELGMAKLNRIQEYAEARICRRKILLSYFGEHLADNCGNCDVCDSPPQTFDGTSIAQKALSAIYRLKEEVAIGMLVDVLRGSKRQDLLAKGYDQIKTYGAGADINTETWQLYLLQMIQQGLVEVAYHQGHSLKLTSASHGVLFEGKKVDFVRQQLYQKREEVEPHFQRSKTKKQILEEGLFADLRTYRQALAQERNVPPYVIFPDPTLKEMAEKHPLTQQAFLEISGVTQRKQAELGEGFVQRIIQYMALKTAEGEKVPNGSQLYTWLLFNSGQNIDQIAAHRELKTDTIYGHFSKLHALGLAVNLDDLVDRQTQEEVLLAIEKVGQEGFKPVFEFFHGKYPFGLLRLIADLG